MAAVAAVISAGCFYESPVPIADQGSLALDSALFGKWRIVEDNDTATIVVLPLDQHAYLIHYYESPPDSVGELTDGVDCCMAYYRAHATDLSAVHFMNLQQLGLSNTNWIFFRYEHSRDGLRVRPLKKDMAQGLATSSALRAFLEKNLTNESIYDEWTELKRVRKIKS